MDEQKVRKSAPERFDDWIGKMKLVSMKDSKELFSEEMHSPAKWSQYRVMLSMVREAMNDRIKRSEHRMHYYEETLDTIAETVAAMMFVQEEIDGEKRKIKEMTGRTNE